MSGIYGQSYESSVIECKRTCSVFWLFDLYIMYCYVWFMMLSENEQITLMHWLITRVNEQNENKKRLVKI